MDPASKANDQFEVQFAGAAELLDNIKRQQETISALHAHFCRLEPDIVYRFYHQSFKVFIAANLVNAVLYLYNLR